jgi:hypothetical protein
MKAEITDSSLPEPSVLEPVVRGTFEFLEFHRTSPELTSDCE